MKGYRKIYYGYQTRARGLLDKDALEQRFTKLKTWYARRLRAYLPENPDAKCLDVPCGYGNFIYFLRDKGYQNIEGLDLDAGQIKLARKLNLPVREADAFEYLVGLQDDYDLISSLDFIEHLSRDEALQFMKLCMQAIKPGGLLILRTPCADGPFGSHDRYNDLTHEWGMTSCLLRALLEMNGFERVSILDERPMPTSALNLIRWLVFFPAKALFSAAYIALGMRPPAIWTRSMMAVAYKPENSRASSGI